MAAKEEPSFFVYPTDATEKDQAYAVFKFAKENNLPRPQYVDEDGTLWRWDNKASSGRHDGHHLIRTAIKYNRNHRDRARRLDRSLTEADFEEAWPGRGRDLFRAEKERQQQLIASRKAGEDVDHYWSLNSGGFHVSNNLRTIPSKQNRAEGDRGVPHELEQIAYMMAETKADQVRLQGPRMLPGATTRLVTKGGKIGLEYILPGADTAATAYDLFTFGRDGEEIVNQAAEVVPGLKADPSTDLGKRAGEAISNGFKNGAKAILKNGRAAVDLNGISSL